MIWWGYKTIPVVCFFRKRESTREKQYIHTYMYVCMYVRMFVCFYLCYDKEVYIYIWAIWTCHGFFFLKLIIDNETIALWGAFCAAKMRAVWVATVVFARGAQFANRFLRLQPSVEMVVRSHAPPHYHNAEAVWGCENGCGWRRSTFGVGSKWMQSKERRSRNYRRRILWRLWDVWRGFHRCG